MNKKTKIAKKNLMKRKKRRKSKLPQQRFLKFFFWQEQQESNNKHKKQKSKQGKVFELVRKNSNWCYKQKMKHGDVKHEKQKCNVFTLWWHMWHYTKDIYFLNNSLKKFPSKHQKFGT